MPFTTKQSDIFFNEKTNEMFVCTVSSVTADRCEGSDQDVVYGAVPIIYRINKDTNYKSLTYPRNLDTITTDLSSDIFDLTPTCPDGTNFSSITKPLINYNKRTDRYTVTFLGKYSADSEGVSIANFTFQDINTSFYLLDSKFYIPKEKFTASQFTFVNGYLNSDLVIGGNIIRNEAGSFFSTYERSPEYLLRPMQLPSLSALGFNLMLDNIDTANDAITGNKAYPFLYSGSYITYNNKYTAFDPEYNIRVDFRARAFTVPSMTAYGSTQNTGVSATRWVQQYDEPNPGEGFCVYFYENVNPLSGKVVPNGVGSTLGYAPADFNINETAGTAQQSDGLIIQEQPGNIGTGNTGTGSQATSFLGIGFDIGGNFCTKSEDKPGWYAHGNGVGSFTQTPCSVGIRGSSSHDTQVLTCVPMSSVPTAGDIPMHVSAANADASDVNFVDYRIDLSNRGRKVTVYNKLTGATDYNTITEFRLDKAIYAGDGNVGSGTKYEAWKNIGTQTQAGNWGEILTPLNVGLTFTTSNNVSFFEIQKFEVTGVKINNPYAKKTKPVPTDNNNDTTDYIEESSKNIRESLVKIKSNDSLDLELVINTKSRIAEIEREKTITDRITLCKGSKPEIIEGEVSVNYTGLSPEEVDETINRVQRGEEVPHLGPTTTYISKDIKDIDVEKIVDAPGQDNYAAGLKDWVHHCTSAKFQNDQGSNFRYYTDAPDPLNGNKDYINIGTGRMYTFDWWVLHIGKYRLWVEALQIHTMEQGIGPVDLMHNIPGCFDVEILLNTAKIVKTFEDNIIDMSEDDPSINWRLNYTKGHKFDKNNPDIGFYAFDPTKITCKKIMIRGKTVSIPKASVDEMTHGTELARELVADYEEIGLIDPDAPQWEKNIAIINIRNAALDNPNFHSTVPIEELEGLDIALATIGLNDTGSTKFDYLGHESAGTGPGGDYSIPEGGNKPVYGDFKEDYDMITTNWNSQNSQTESGETVKITSEADAKTQLADEKDVQVTSSANNTWGSQQVVLPAVDPPATSSEDADNIGTEDDDDQGEYDYSSGNDGGTMP